MGQKPVKPQPNATAKKQTPLKPKKKPVVERKALRRPIALDEAVERVKASINMPILIDLLTVYNAVSDDRVKLDYLLKNLWRRHK